MIISRLILNLRKVSKKTENGGSLPVIGSILPSIDFRASVVDELDGELRMDDEEIEDVEGDGVEEFELVGNIALPGRERWLDLEEPLEDAYEPVASGSGLHD